MSLDGHRGPPRDVVDPSRPPNHVPVGSYDKASAGANGRATGSLVVGRVRPPPAARDANTTAAAISLPTSSTLLQKSSPAAQGPSVDGGTIMPRNPSIDSTISTASSTSTSQRPNGTSIYRVSPEPSGPQDIAALIAAAGGSAEAAIQRLIAEKNQGASHNAQLWRLVEKQRTMILGLNKDLEKALKEKERYRRRIKEQSAPSQLGQIPNPDNKGTSLEHQVRDISQSPIVGAESVGAVGSRQFHQATTDGLRINDISDAGLSDAGRLNASRDVSNAPSSTMPATPLSGTSLTATTRAGELDTTLASIAAQEAATAGDQFANVPPQLRQSPQDSVVTPIGTVPNVKTSFSNPSSPSTSSQGFASPKSASSRKAPPAPLRLSSSAKNPDQLNVTNNIIDASDSEYEEGPNSSQAEYRGRGRRRTREDDDRQREVQVHQEIEARSRSLKDKQSKSRPAAAHAEGFPPRVESTATAQPFTVDRSVTRQPDHTTTVIPAHPGNDPMDSSTQRVRSNTAGNLPKSSTAPSLMSPGLPSLMSPGLPMSPRPGDRPMNSFFPRGPVKVANSISMTPSSMAFPLSPRAPRQPIPLPPQTPLTFTSPHLARAETYQTTNPNVTVTHARSSPNLTPDPERSSTSSDPTVLTPGDVYKGLMTDQYPGLLLPPNALPLIYIKIASSRMKQSRQSYIAPRPGDENPVFTLAVHERSDNKQLWRVEKTFAALATLDQQVKATCAFRERMPDKTLFAGHAPAKIDARRIALDSYVSRMLDAIGDENSALVFCKFLSTDAIGAAENSDYFTTTSAPRIDTPQTKQRLYREGYLTKRGKNFGGWKARYFVLDGPNLKYFDDRGGAQLGAIKLRNAQIGKQSNKDQNSHEDEDNQFRHAFLILEPKRKDSSSLVRHVLCAENDEERDSWVEALLQYVDYNEEDGENQVKGGGVQITKTNDLSGPRSPRLQKSMNDLRPSSQQKDKDSLFSSSDHLRAVGYSDTVAGDAPIMGNVPPALKETPSPTHDGGFFVADQHATHPNISGPSNLQLIGNDWGMKAAPTPLGKDKKRGLFSGFRGRSSSDLDNKNGSPRLTPQDYQIAGPVRAVFGVPLAEAVEFGRPLEITTELPVVVYRCLEYLVAKNAIEEEGIFRLSGSNTVIKGLKDRFNTEGDVNLTGDSKYYDVHAVASLLKLYLRELPSSILTRDLHLEFLQCLEIQGKDKIVALNGLVNRLPTPNYALLQALSSFLSSIVNNAEQNKMNIRNVGIVFAPTLNVPAPLISSFVEEESTIFGPPITDVDRAKPVQEYSHSSSDLRSPRKQMFQDLPTPAYNQTTFQSLDAFRGEDTGMIPVHPTYASFRMAPQGDGGYGSLNDALRSPTVYNTVSNGVPSTRDAIKVKRRESSLLGASNGGVVKKTSMSQLREEESTSF